MSKVLVTGATGFLGKYMVAELVDNGYEVIAQGRNEDRLNQLIKDYKIPTLKCSLSEIGNIDLEIDYVIHGAALSTVWGKWQDFYSSNVEGTESIISFCRKNKVKRLVYVSTPSVYTDKKHRFNISENDYDKKNKLNFYIKSKLMAEELVNKAYENGLSTVIIRPRGLFGIGDTSLIPRLINANETIGIPLFNNGTNLVDITCVENVALSLRLAMEAENAAGRTYNITNGEPMEFKMILEKLFKKIGKKPRYKRLPLGFVYCVATVLESFYKLFGIYKEPALTRYTVLTLGYSQTLNIEQAKSDFGYSPKITIEEGIQKYADHFKKQDNRC